MSYLDWHVGMDVVFVGCEGFHVTGQPLEVGRVYTIAGMHMSGKGDRVRGADGDIYLLMEDALYINLGDRPWYHARAFRPVQKRKTDISIFTAMLNDQHTEVPA
jgi:hypothetical protein